VSIAAANASVNGVAVETSESFPSGRLFDVVMANIIADTLIELSTALYGITKPGGILVASGIIDTREGDVVAAMERAGFELLDANRQSEWVALVCRRGAA